MKRFSLLVLALLLSFITVDIINAGSDSDSFSDNVETYIGTNPYAACPAPPDFNVDGWVSNADLILMGSSFNKIFPDPAYNARYDLNANGSVTNSDLILMGPGFNTWCNANAPVPDTIARNAPPIAEHEDPIPSNPCIGASDPLWQTRCTTNTGPCAFDPDDTFWKTGQGNNIAEAAMCSYNPGHLWVFYGRDMSQNPDPFDVTVTVNTLGTDQTITAHSEDGYLLGCIQSIESDSASTYYRPYNLLGGGSLIRGAKDLPETVTASIVGGRDLSIQLFTTLDVYPSSNPVGVPPNVTPLQCPQTVMTTNGYWWAEAARPWPQFGFRWNYSN